MGIVLDGIVFELIHAGCSEYIVIYRQVHKTVNDEKPIIKKKKSNTNISYDIICPAD